ncbi:hypothetical protein NQ317_015277 [Molorchus minor]|uniref:Uncharacterized protein n=1 Tax=Molorchus minor TaxID=1323400 RepID=A0ABQ9JBX7_9CUCU|nr:hypothetical protein NQ317_015277 [Molorchus minor]
MVYVKEAQIKIASNRKLLAKKNPYVSLKAKGFGYDQNLNIFSKENFFKIFIQLDHRRLISVKLSTLEVNPIHFHVIANKISRENIKTLFDTWNVPQVNITFYDLNELTAEVRWVPNSHYSEFMD